MGLSKDNEKTLGVGSPDCPSETREEKADRISQDIVQSLDLDWPTVSLEQLREAIKDIAVVVDTKFNGRWRFKSKADVINALKPQDNLNYQPLKNITKQIAGSNSLDAKLVSNTLSRSVGQLTHLYSPPQPKYVPVKIGGVYEELARNRKAGNTMLAPDQAFDWKAQRGFPTSSQPSGSQGDSNRS